MSPLKSQKNAVKKNITKPAMTIKRIQSDSLTYYENDDFSKQTELSKQAVHRNDAQDTSAPLSVTITCDQKGFLWKEESELILTAIQKQIISEASSTKLDTSRPTFNAQPLYEEGVLKLWCDNDHTLAWLKNTVSGLKLTGSSLVVKSQLEIKKGVRCKFNVPDKQRVFKEPADIGRAVSYQNTWVNVGRWALINARQSDDETMWFVRVEVPEDQIPTLLKAGRRLSIGLMTVHIFFEGRGGNFNAEIPLGWDPATETIVKQPTTSRKPKTVQPSTIVPFVIASDAHVL